MRPTRVRVEFPPEPPTGRNLVRRVPLGAFLRRVLAMGILSPADPGTAASNASDASVGQSTDRSASDSGAPAAAERRALSGFERFYRTNYATVTRLAYSLCGSLAVAEELAQEAFVAAHSRWRRISRFDRPDLWVRRVVINRSISHRRRLASERTALERISQRVTDRAEPELPDDEVWLALRELSPRQAEVLALVYIEDRPIAEVAEILELGEETIRTHLKRGRAALAARLAAAGNEVET